MNPDIPKDNRISDEHTTLPEVPSFPPERELAQENFKIDAIDDSIPRDSNNNPEEFPSSIRTMLMAISGLRGTTREDKARSMLNCFEAEKSQFKKEELNILFGFFAASATANLKIITNEDKRSMFEAVEAIVEDLTLDDAARFLNYANMLKYSDDFIENLRTVCSKNLESLSISKALLTAQGILESKTASVELKSETLGWLGEKVSKVEPSVLSQMIDMVSRSKLTASEFAEVVIPRLEDLKLRLGQDFPRALSAVINLKGLSADSHHRLAVMLFDARDDFRSDVFISVASKLVRDGYCNPEFVRVVAETALNRSDSLGGAECAKLVRMFENTKWRHPGYLSEIGNRLSEVAFHTDPHLLVEVAVNFAKLDIRMPRLMSSIASLSPTKLNNLSPNKFKSLLGACAAENIIPVNLLSFIDQTLPGKEMAESYLSSALWSYSTLNEPCPNIINKIKEVYPRLIETGYLQCADAALIMRSAVVLDPEMGRDFWREFSKHKIAQTGGQEGELNLTKLDQEISDLKEPALFGLYHSLVSLNLDVPENLNHRVESINTYKEYAGPKPNNFERSVSTELDALGLHAIPQKWFEGYYIDFLVEYGGRKIALECDGFKYHSAGMQAGARLNGKSILKEEFLKARGFEVVRIPSREWLRVEDKQHFLTQLLKLDPN